MKSKNIIIYAFQSLEDPLVKGLILEYILRLDETNINFHFITHEQKEFELSETEKIKKAAWLKSRNIFWYPVNYKSGNFLLLKKLFNFLQTFFICLKIKLKYKPKAILGFLSLSGGFSFILSRLLALELIVFCYEPHSQYMVDFGIWKKTGLPYKLLHTFEKLQLKYAAHVVLPTTYAMENAQLANPKSKKYLVPISVDTGFFNFSDALRNKIRNQIGAKEKQVIIYTGKIGGIYYNAEEIVSFFKKLIDCADTYFLYIITPQTEEFRNSLFRSKIPADSFFLSGVVSFDELAGHISAADIGLIAIPPLPSQKFRTPVKTGIYLSCGLPYIINKGIAEDDIMAEKESVGLVISDMNSINAEHLHHQLKTFLSENKASLQNRCRQTAINYRGIENALDVLKKITSDVFK